jgi:hypothetical protein
MIRPALRAIALFVALMSAIGESALAQSVRYEDLQKVPDNVVQAAKRGERQELFVLLDGREIEREEALKRARRGLKINDEAIEAETLKELKNLKEEVFPGGKLGNAVVVRNRDYVPLVDVAIPDWESLARIISHPKVRFVFESRKVPPASTDNSFLIINQPSVAKMGFKGAGYRIAVIDTGVAYRNWVFSATGGKDLVGCRFSGVPANAFAYYTDGPYIGSANCKLSSAISAFYSPARQDPSSFYDTSRSWGDAIEDYPYSWGHGSLVTGIALATSPDVKIDAIAAADTSGQLRTQWIFNGLDWVLSHAAGGVGPIVAVNLSVGSTATYAGDCSNTDEGATYKSFFAQLLAKGIVPVVASGNNAAKGALAMPACVPGAVSVGSVYDYAVAVSTSDSLSQGGTCSEQPKIDKVVCSSNSSKSLTLLAPGHNVSLENGQGGGGTSQAAPLVAGGVALLKSAYPKDSPDTTIFRLATTGKSIGDTNFISKPRIDLYAAVETAVVSGGTGGGTGGTGGTGGGASTVAMLAAVESASAMALLLA